MNDIHEDAFADHTQQPPDDVLAGEYALGLHSGEQRVVLERRLDSDPAFADAVQRWHAQLAPLFDEIPAHPVPAHVWASLSQRIGFNATPLKSTAPVHARPSLWNSLRFWRGFAATATTAAAICLLAVLGLHRQSSPGETPTVASTRADKAMTATLANPDGHPGYVAMMDVSEHEITLMPLDRTATPGKVPELWLLSADGHAHSIGVFDDQRSKRMPIPASLTPMFDEDAALAVTMEPPGGAPGGVATGTVVARGGITRLAFAP